MKKMRNIKLVLEYDGSRFFGFQKQSRHVTVQETLEAALSRLFNRKMKIRSASGRTDAGVHAREQVVHFMSPSPMETGRIQKALNGILPAFIAVRKVEEMAFGFHARYHAKSKVYEYRIWNHQVRSPLEAAQTWHIPYALDLKKMREAAKILTGRHDFRSFCSAAASRRAAKDTVRTLMRFDVKRQGSLVIIRVEADGFLYRMVRNLVGTLVDIGSGKLPVTSLSKILKARDRRQAGPTAPANGLSLVKVNY